MQLQNTTHFIIRPKRGKEPERLSNKTNLIICIRTQMWPCFNVDSDVSLHIKSTLTLPLQPSFENNLITRNELILKHRKPSCGTKVTKIMLAGIYCLHNGCPGGTDQDQASITYKRTTLKGITLSPERYVKIYSRHYRFNLSTCLVMNCLSCLCLLSLVQHSSWFRFPTCYWGKNVDKNINYFKNSLSQWKELPLHLWLSTWDRDS